jgi:hypothetical protein
MGGLQKQLGGGGTQRELVSCSGTGNFARFKPKNREVAAGARTGNVKRAEKSEAYSGVA